MLTHGQQVARQYSGHVKTSPDKHKHTESTEWSYHNKQYRWGHPLFGKERVRQRDELYECMPVFSGPWLLILFTGVNMDARQDTFVSNSGTKFCGSLG